MTLYRVWAIFYGARDVWIPVSGLFPDEEAARSWAAHLNTEYRIEAEDDE